MAGDLGSPSSPLCVAIVGSGPSGFYAAECLLKAPLKVQVDMLERLPVPFGLVRYGVAPDHPKLKQPAQVFDKIAQTSGFRFFGNVTVGHDVTVEQLRSTHHAILFAYGAETDRALGVDGEDLPGSHTATEFVGWYNGHPDYRDRTFDLSAEVAVIVGQGNVAADVARILTKPVDELRMTDISEHALDALASSRVREIHIVGRRGPAQAKFTNKELRELGELSNCLAEVSASDLELGATCEKELADKSNFVAAKNIEIFRSWSGRRASQGEKRIVFHFLKRPVGLGGRGRLEFVTLERGVLAGPPFAQSAEATGNLEPLNCGLLFRSIGYQGRPLDGLPFDPSKGVLIHEAGRIAGSPGLYAAGWIKRGPSGIIGTNRADSVATVATLMSDLPRLDTGPKTGGNGLHEALALRGTKIVSYPDWLRLDEMEVRRGALTGKPREKMTRVREMLEALQMAAAA
jgi:ferredoxin/flavodoxin---NADP+ reductase